jgi:hypothetical protein
VDSLDTHICSGKIPSIGSDSAQTTDVVSKRFFALKHCASHLQGPLSGVVIKFNVLSSIFNPNKQKRAASRENIQATPKCLLKHAGKCA